MLHGIFLDRKGYLYEIFLFSGSNSLPFNSFPPYWNLEFAYANCFQSDRSIHAPVFWLINSSWTLASNLIQQHSSICTSLSFFNHCSDKALYLWTEAPRVFVALLSFLTKAPSKKVWFRYLLQFYDVTHKIVTVGNNYLRSSGGGRIKNNREFLIFDNIRWYISSKCYYRGEWEFWLIVYQPLYPFPHAVLDMMATEADSVSSRHISLCSRFLMQYWL